MIYQDVLGCFQWKNVLSCLQVFKIIALQYTINLVKLLIYALITQEYFSTHFNSLMACKDIVHQSKCPHTPQQNDVVSLKQLVFSWHCIVPLKFQSDNVLIAGYIINCKSPSLLINQVPYFFLYPPAPLYNVHPCVFGSTCFVHNLALSLDKLAARAVKCVFLGYSWVQKGNMHYSPSTNPYISVCHLFQGYTIFCLTSHSKIYMLGITCSFIWRCFSLKLFLMCHRLQTIHQHQSIPFNHLVSLSTVGHVLQLWRLPLLKAPVTHLLLLCLHWFWLNLSLPLTFTSLFANICTCSVCNLHPLYIFFSVINLLLGSLLLAAARILLSKLVSKG